MAKKSNRFITQATQDALVRFGPEISGLKALIQQAQSDRKTGIGAARSTAQSITSAVDAARPQVAGIYKQAATTQNRVSDQVVHDIAGLTGVNPSIVAALDVEHAASSDRTSGSRAAALTDLTRQRVSAQRGKQWAIQNANQGFSSAVGKVLQRRVDLLNEQGAFIASEAGKARTSAAERRQQMKMATARLTQQERNAIRSSGVDPDTGKPTESSQIKIDAAKQKQKVDAQKLKQKQVAAAKPKMQTPGALVGAQSTISEIANRAKTYEKNGLSRQQIVQKLAKGRPRQTIKVNPDTGQKLDNPVVLGAIPAYKPDLLMTAALDVSLDGHLSRQTEQKLRKAGFNIGALGFTTYAQWRRQMQKRHPVLGNVQPGTVTVGVGGSASN